MDEFVQARSVTVPRSNEGQSYSIRFLDSNGNLSMRANFTEMYDSNGNLVKDKAAKFDEIYTKYRGKKSLSLISSADLKKRCRLKHHLQRLYRSYRNKSNDVEKLIFQYKNKEILNL